MYTKPDSMSCAIHGKYITDCRDCRLAYSRNKYKEVMSTYVTCSECNANLRKKYIYIGILAL